MEKTDGIKGEGVLMNYRLQAKILDLPEFCAPFEFLELWKQVPERAVGFYATLKEANFCLKADLQADDNFLKVTKKDQVELIQEGRFFWKSEEQPNIEAEIRWIQTRDFNRHAQWHLVLAGNFWDDLSTHGFQVEEVGQNDVERSEALAQTWLWQKELPKRFQYPNCSDQEQMMLKQRVWLKEKLPFYYQWTDLVPADQ